MSVVLTYNPFIVEVNFWGNVSRYVVASDGAGCILMLVSSGYFTTRLVADDIKISRPIFPSGQSSCVAAVAVLTVTEYGREYFGQLFLCFVPLTHFRSTVYISPSMSFIPYPYLGFTR